MLLVIAVATVSKSVMALVRFVVCVKKKGLNVSTESGTLGAI